MIGNVQLGLGLIGIGRDWGYPPGSPPPLEEVEQLLRAAVELGVTFFDTAPSYGTSEKRLGMFLRTLEQPTLRALTVATKFGETWNAVDSQPRVDHSYDALCRSLDDSLTHLPRIDVLQVHKATTAVLRNADVRRAIRHAVDSANIRLIGASVSDVGAASVALDDEAVSFVQLPFNQANSTLESVFEKAKALNKFLVINRPFGGGRLVTRGHAGNENSAVDAFRFILRQDFTGVILTGTKSAAHLRENANAFRAALAEEHSYDDNPS